MYKALYRTWRPKVFEDIIGQDHITTTLKNQVRLKKIAHSYLFTGSRGIGKTTSSKVFAKAINCLDNKDGNPCGECENCVDFENGTLTDTVEMDAASNNGVDDIRALREEAVYLPVSAKYRVYIIDEAHMLSKGAFNALLKIMEEPPAHVVFILATTELNKVPATIISRCQRFDFFRVSPLNIKNMLMKIAKEEGINLLEDAALNISIIANGSVRDAISLLDQTSSLEEQITEEMVNRQAGTADRKKITELSDYIIDKKPGEALLLIDQLYKLSVDLKNISGGLLLHFRNIMLAKELKDPRDFVFVSDIEWRSIETQAKKLSLHMVLHAIEVLSTLHENLSGSVGSKALFESVILRLTNPNLDNSLAGILRRIGEIEQKLEEKSYEKKQDSQKTLKTKKQTDIKTENKIEIKTGESDIKISDEDFLDKKEEVDFKKELDENLAQEKFPTEDPEELSDQENIELTSDFKDNKESDQEESEIKNESLSEEDLADGDVLQVDEKLTAWQEILEYLKKKNPPLEATLEGSVAYVKADLILIDAPNTVFFDLMRASEQTKESLRQAIEIKTGHQYRLGPVKKGTTVKKAENNLLEKLEKEAVKQGLIITKK